MKHITALLLITLTAAWAWAGPGVSISFKKSYTVLDFRNITIKEIRPHPAENKIILTVTASLKEKHTVVDYRALKTVSFFTNRIEILLSYQRNYFLNANTLYIMDSFPQKAIALEPRVPLYEKNDISSTLETELIQGALCHIIKNKKNWLFAEIPDQGDHAGWLKEEQVNLLLPGNFHFDAVISQKDVVMTTHDGSRRNLQGGTPYSILKEGADRTEIELTDGTRGFIPHRSPLLFQGLRHSLVETAREFLGVPYLWGGTTGRGLDCSGLTWLVYRMNDIKIPRDGTPQFKSGKRISQKDLQPGDLVFFSTFKPGPSHVGLYIGSGEFIHAATEGVRISSLSEKYWAKRLYGCVTLLSETD
ncbi:MAG TPA: NlpC/P60 family protein [Firmicutes bacterium]|nr:NlpC/P60 family protein [Bacillota bacterium]